MIFSSLLTKSDNLCLAGNIAVSLFSLFCLAISFICVVYVSSKFISSLARMRLHVTARVGFTVNASPKQAISFLFSRT